MCPYPLFAGDSAPDASIAREPPGEKSGRMTARADDYSTPLDRAREHTRTWLASQADRPVPPRVDADEVVKALGETLPDGPSDPTEVVDLLAEAVEPGLMAMPSGRFFGWVIGGTLPAALASDWLVSAWDQNCLLYTSPSPRD